VFFILNYSLTVIIDMEANPISISVTSSVQKLLDNIERSPSKYQKCDILTLNFVFCLIVGLL